jgi:Flp pilus assembly protein protease CpaA
VIADVWSRRDFVAAGIVLAAVALVALGQWLGISWLTNVGAAVALVGMAVLIAWRVVGGPDRRRGPDGKV